MYVVPASLAGFPLWVVWLTAAVSAFLVIWAIERKFEKSNGLRRRVLNCGMWVLLLAICVALVQTFIE